MLKLNLQAIGNVTKDASHRVTGNGKDVLSFTIAVNHGTKEQPRTEYIDCSIWGERAKSRLGEYLVKGAKIAVNGIPGTNAYISQQDNEAKATLTLMVDQVELMGGNSGSSNSGDAAPAQAAPAARGNAAPAAPAARGKRQAAPAAPAENPDDLDW